MGMGWETGMGAWKGESGRRRGGGGGLYKRGKTHATGDPGSSDPVPLDGALDSEEGIQSGKLNLQILDREM